MVGDINCFVFNLTLPTAVCMRKHGSNVNVFFTEWDGGVNFLMKSVRKSLLCIMKDCYSEP